MTARNAFIPFATGARKRIGDTIAMAEATLATITARRRRRTCPAGADRLYTVTLV